MLQSVSAPYAVSAYLRISRIGRSTEPSSAQAPVAPPEPVREEKPTRPEETPAPISFFYGMTERETRTAAAARDLAERFGPVPAGEEDEDRQAPETAVGTDEEADEADAGEEDEAQTGGMDAERGVDGETLSTEEMQEVEQLRARDAEVRQHEQAHKAAAGGLAIGGASFKYQTGPDGKRYATGGEVQVDMAGGSTPGETVSRMQRVQAAALAPANPSAQDRRVASEAAQREAAARQEMTVEAGNLRDGAEEESSPSAAPEALRLSRRREAIEAYGRPAVSAA